MIRETNVHILSRRELADWAESVRADVGVLPGPEMTASMIKTAIAHAEDAARLAKLVRELTRHGVAATMFKSDVDHRPAWALASSEAAEALKAHRKLAEEA